MENNDDIIVEEKLETMINEAEKDQTDNDDVEEDENDDVEEEEANSEDENTNIQDIENIKKILFDFTNDLLITFPELKDTLNSDLNFIVHNTEDDENLLDSVNKKIYVAIFYLRRI